MQVVKEVDIEVVWSDCLQFLAYEAGYISEQNMIHMKDDAVTLVNLYRLY